MRPAGRPIAGQAAGHRADDGQAATGEVQGELATIAPTTATRPPGIAFTHRPKTTRIAMTATDTATVRPFAWPTLAERRPGTR